MSWEPIETAPLDGTEVLLLCPLVESEMTMGWFNEGRWCSVFYGKPFNPELWQPAYWHPLPATPTFN